MLASVSSAVLRGVSGIPVIVEVHVAGGLPAFTVVGLPDASCREARDRVRAAILSSGLAWPQQRITVNLAPSGLPKAGSGLDLAMAVGVVVAAGLLAPELVADTAFLGEVGLDGSLRAVTGVVPLVDAMEQTTVVVPLRSEAEALVLGRHVVRAASSLRAVLDSLQGRSRWEHGPPLPPVPCEAGPDLAEVRGQSLARRAVEVAAAGGHHLLMVGPPGAGKTMLAQRLVGLLPAMGAEAALQATKVHSAAGERLPPGGLLRRPPFRGPAPRKLDGGVGRRGIELAATRRDQPGQWRCVVPRRIGRVQPFRARCAAPTAGRRAHPGGARPRLGAVPRPLPVGGRVEPLPVRRRRYPRALPLFRGIAPPVPSAAVRTAPRSLRPAPGCPTSRSRPPDPVQQRGELRHRAGAGDPGPRAVPPPWRGAEP